MNTKKNNRYNKSQTKNRPSRLETGQPQHIYSTIHRTCPTIYRYAVYCPLPLGTDPKKKTGWDRVVKTQEVSRDMPLAIILTMYTASGVEGMPDMLTTKSFGGSLSCAAVVLAMVWSELGAS